MPISPRAATAQRRCRCCAKPSGRLRVATRRSASALDGLHCAMTHNTPIRLPRVSRRAQPRFSRMTPRRSTPPRTPTPTLSLRSSQDLAQRGAVFLSGPPTECRGARAAGQVGRGGYRVPQDSRDQSDAAGRSRAPGPGSAVQGASPSPADVEQAKKNFEEELEIDPQQSPRLNMCWPSLAADSSDSATAIRHFERATKLDSRLSPRLTSGLGTALNSAKRFRGGDCGARERTRKLAPDSPTGHYQLAFAYAGAGRRDDANREAGHCNGKPRKRSRP
jgi:hypothetical protein